MRHHTCTSTRIAANIGSSSNSSNNNGSNHNHNGYTTEWHGSRHMVIGK
jgi:hypothetical protein